MSANLRRNSICSLLAALLAGLLLVSACGGDDDDAGGGATTQTQAADGGAGETSTADADNGDEDDGEELNVCDLLSNEEVSAALGSEVSEPVRQDFPPFFSCYWTAEEFDSLSVSVFSGSESEAEAYYELTAGAQDVEGLGDRAQFSDFGTLEILAGRYDVSITLFDIDLEDDAQTIEAARPIAELVLDRLP